MYKLSGITYIKVIDQTTLILALYIQPGSKLSVLSGVHGESLKLKVNSPPVDGRANLEVVSFIQTWLNLNKNQIELIKGHKSRYKQVKISAVTIDVIEKLSNL